MERKYMTDMDKCYICGSPYVEIHHIFYGTANRAVSDKYHLVIPLCKKHHTGEGGIHFNPELDNDLKQMAQKFYEDNYGTREDFRRDFGKSWL